MLPEWDFGVVVQTPISTAIHCQSLSLAVTHCYPLLDTPTANRQLGGGEETNAT